MTPKKNILVYRLGSLGDTIIALPSFHLVREKFPDSNIILLTNKPVASKAAPVEAILGKKNSHFYNHIIHYPVGTRNLFLLFSIIWKIRSLGIDTMVNITAARSKKSSVRDKIFFRLAGIKNLFGFPEKEEDFHVMMDPQTGKYEWEAKRLSRRLTELGEINLNKDAVWDLKLNQEEIYTSKYLLHEISKKSEILVISTGTKLQANDWEMHNWILLMEKLSLKLPDWTLIVVGAEEESDRAEQCLTAWKGKGINLCGKTSPRVSAAVLKQARVFIGHDSGPLHLASAVGTLTVGIFSARNNAGQWFPRGDSNEIIYHKTECAGCGLLTCIEEQKKCILSISVSEVEEKVLKIIRINYSKLHDINLNSSFNNN